MRQKWKLSLTKKYLGLCQVAKKYRKKYINLKHVRKVGLVVIRRKHLKKKKNRWQNSCPDGGNYGELSLISNGIFIPMWLPDYNYISKNTSLVQKFFWCIKWGFPKFRLLNLLYLLATLKYFLYIEAHSELKRWVMLLCFIYAFAGV